MSLLGKVEADIEMKAPASKLFEIIHKNPHHLSNVSGDKVEGVKLHEGEWGKVGSIINWNYYHDGEAKVAKHLIEAVDEEKHMITFKVLQSDLLKHYKTFKFRCQVTPKGKGSVVHCGLEYEKLHGNVPDAHSMLHLCVALCKDLEAHLMEVGFGGMVKPLPLASLSEGLRITHLASLSEGLRITHLASLSEGLRITHLASLSEGLRITQKGGREGVEKRIVTQMMAQVEVGFKV
ncbi:MLP-like protein 31, partial [Cucurbita argyrosperma subsp. sororia]